jgi:hypothetical protein
MLWVGVCCIEQQPARGRWRRQYVSYAEKMMQIRRKSGYRGDKSIAKQQKVTYNEWFFSELRFPG